MFRCGPSVFGACTTLSGPDLYKSLAPYAAGLQMRRYTACRLARIRIATVDVPDRTSIAELRY